MEFRIPLIVALVSTATLVACYDIPDDVTAVKNFSPERYAGRWYEVARSDNRFERGMDNVTANYTLGEKGRITVHNQGYLVDKGRWEDITGKAYVVGTGDEARLKVSFFGPFYSGYNVIALDPDYRYSLVVGNDLSYVWILSRTPQMPAEVRRTYMDRVHTLGVDTTALIRVAHDRTADAPRL